MPWTILVSIHLFNEYRLTAFSGPITILGAGDSAVNKADDEPALRELTLSGVQGARKPTGTIRGVIVRGVQDLTHSARSVLQAEGSGGLRFLPRLTHPLLAVLALTLACCVITGDLSAFCSPISSPSKWRYIQDGKYHSEGWGQEMGPWPIG